MSHNEYKYSEDKELEDFDRLLLRKKKRKKTSRVSNIDTHVDYKQYEPEWVPYAYIELLERMVSIIQARNPQPDKIMSFKHRIELIKVGSKKTMWSTFPKICSVIQRPMDDVMTFFICELNTQASLDQNKNLILKGRFKQKEIENLLTKYITEYVTCSTCQSLDTVITRDPATRMSNMVCTRCNAHRSVAPIRSGFHATSRADRKTLKSI